MLTAFLLLYCILSAVYGGTYNTKGVTFVSRPKGSKNKKTLLAEAQIDERIAEQKAAKRKLESEQKRILNQMENLKQALKANKKALRAAERNLAGMQAKKAENEAIAAEAQKKMEIEKVVSTLISSGKPAGEILEMLNK